MAELVLQIETDHPSYDDGDVLCAFSDTRIGEVHASHICHPRKFPFTKDGLREPGTLLQDFQTNAYTHRFDRISKTEVLRTDLQTGAQDILGPKANDQGEAMDVAQFVANRVSHEAHTVFGVPGSEFWFGGNYTPHVNRMWARIEERTPLRREAHRLWPLTDTEKRRFLAVKLDDDLTEQQTQTLTKPLIGDNDEEGNPIVLKRRAHRVPWRVVIAPAVRTKFSLARLRDRNVIKDIREVAFTRTITQRKASV